MQNPLTLIEIKKDGSVVAPGQLPTLAETVCASMAMLYEGAGFQPPWVGYLAYDGNYCIGTCAFKTPPEDGAVEIAYFTFPQFEGKGFATRMAEALVKVAREQDPKILVRAQTLPEKNASTKILEKLQFQFKGPVEHPEDGTVWEWQL